MSNWVPGMNIIFIVESHNHAQTTILSDLAEMFKSKQLVTNSPKSKQPVRVTTMQATQASTISLSAFAMKRFPSQDLIMQGQPERGGRKVLSVGR